MSAEYREYIDPTTATVKRRRLDLTEREPENSFITERNYMLVFPPNAVIPEKLLNNPTTIAKKPDYVFAKTSAGTNHREFVIEELTSNKTSETERLLISIEEPLVLTEIADVIDGNKLESRERETEVETSVTIITPSTVTEIPQQNPIEGQPVLRKAVEKPKEAKQQAKAAEREAVVPQVVIKQSEGNKLEQESLELAMQLAEEDRLEQLRKDELEQQSLTPAMKLEEEEARIKLEASLAKLGKDRQQLEREKAEQLRLEKEAEEREKLEAERLARQQEAERLAKIEEDRLAKLEEAELLAKQQAEEREAEKPRKIEVKKKAELELLVKHLEARKLKIEKEEGKRDEAAEQLKEKLAELKKAIPLLKSAKKLEKLILEEEKTDINLIAEGKKTGISLIAEAEKTAKEIQTKLKTLQKSEIEDLSIELEGLSNGVKNTALVLTNEVCRLNIQDLGGSMARLKAELKKQQAAKLPAKQLEEAIHKAELAVKKLETARLNVNDEQTTKLEETTQVSIKEGKKLLRTGEQAGLEELTEELETLTKGMSATAAAYENPKNIKSIEKAVKPRQEREEAEQRVELLPEQQAAKLLAKQSLKETPSEKQPSLSLCGKVKKWAVKTLSSSSSSPEIEMKTFPDSETSNEEKDMELVGYGDLFTS